MFNVKDSGERKSFDSGMVRDVTDNKTDYSLCFDGVMFKRWAEHITKGATKYSKRNWMKANGQEELDRFRESAVRHFVQWLYGESDEDHASAVFFNINGYETLKEKIEEPLREDLEILRRHKLIEIQKQEDEKRKNLLKYKVDYSQCKT